MQIMLARHGGGSGAARNLIWGYTGGIAITHERSRS